MAIPIRAATEPAGPILCAGSDSQPRCEHYRNGACNEQRNLTFDYVHGGSRPAHPVHKVREPGIRCGPLANWYEPKRPERGPPAGQPF